VILEAIMYIPEAAMSYFSIFVRSFVTWFIVGRKITVLEETQNGKTECQNQEFAKKRINF